MKKIFLIAVALGVLFVVVNYKYFYRFPHVISRWNAKEFCSCFYVMEQDESFCRERVRQWLPIQDLKIDHDKKTVWVRGLWLDARAAFEGPKFGCRLVETPIVP